MVLDGPDHSPESKSFGEPSRPAVSIEELLQPVGQLPVSGLRACHLPDLP